MKRKLLAWLLVLSLVAALLPAVSAEGKPGDGKSTDDPNFGYNYRFVTRDSIEITSYYGYEAEVTVPSSIDGYTVVGIRSFHSKEGYNTPNTFVTKVILPDTVTYIADDAFYDEEDWSSQTHSALREIVLPEGLKTIGERAFFHNEYLQKVEIPASVTEIGKGAFAACTNLSSIVFKGENTFLHGGAFGARYGYGAGSFAGKLNELYQNWLYDDSAPDFLVWQGQLLAYKGTGKTPVIPDSVKVIGAEAFWGADITGVTIPSGVQEIGSYAFYECEALTAADIPGSAALIGDNAFSGCTALKSLALHEGLKTLGYSAFRDCEALTSVALPEGLTECLECVFDGCEALAQITFPSSLTRITLGDIGETAYYYALPDNAAIYCGSVFLGYKGAYPSSLTIRPGTKTVNIEYQPDGLNRLILPDGLETFILKYGGDNCGITSLTFPESVDYIDCSYLPQLTSVKLPQEAELAQGAFDSCWKLGSVTIPKGNPYLCAFTDCHAIEILTIPDDVLELGAVGGAGLKSVNLGKIRILGENALKDKTRLESVTLPDTLVSIGENALSGCQSLTSLKGGGNVKTLGVDCFKDCIALTNLGDLSGSVCSICNGAFENTGWYHDQPNGPVYFGTVAYTYKGTIPANTVLALKPGTTSVSWGYIFEHESRYWEKEDVKNVVAIVLPDSVRYVGGSAFANCENLKSIDLGGVQYIDDLAFNSHGCESIVLPDTVRYVGDNAFSGTALRAIHLNNGLRVLEEGAFFSYGAGKGVTIPASVTYLGVHCLGYYPLDPENPLGGVETIPDFIICGASGTAAETYANENGITFRNQVGCTSHEYVTETLSPTCQTGGFTRKTCTLCGDVEVSGKTAVGSHKAAANATIDATCTQPGYTGGSHCVSCGETLSAPTRSNPLGHQWRTDTMGENDPMYCGMIWHYCSRCKTTWYEPGSGTHTHDYTYSVSTVLPTCTQKGYTVHTCACGDSYTDSYVDALGHDFVDGVCTRCGIQEGACDGGATCPGRNFTDMPAP
ncbi:MAG: leucine-rich repeat domain-containing protein, partial [Faecousia sp.]